MNPSENTAGDQGFPTAENSSTTNNNTTSAPKGSAVAGASGGTLLVLLANELPPTNLRSFLILAAPAFTVVTAKVWSWCMEAADRRVREMQAKSAISRMRGVIEKALARTGNSEEHQMNLKRRLEELDNFEIDGLAALVSTSVKRPKE